jgi:GT2 family glycosyltransferase
MIFRNLSATSQKMQKNQTERSKVHFAVSDIKRVSLDMLRLRGWCVAPQNARVTAQICNIPAQEISLRIEREDVQKKFGLPSGSLQGFSHFFQVGQEWFDSQCADVSVKITISVGNDVHFAESYEFVATKFERKIISRADVGFEPFPIGTGWDDKLDSELMSVVLAVFNCEEYLQEAIDSVLRQSYSNLELILVDDGSTDSTRLIVEAAAKKDSRVRPIFLPNNMGQCAGFNAGICLARGALTSFLDADDFWFENKLEKLQALVQSAPDDTVMFQHNLEIYRDKIATGQSFRPSLLIGDVVNHARQTGIGIPGPFIPTAGLSFRTEVLRAVYPIPQSFRICADGFLTRSAATFGEVASTNTCLGAYRIHGSNHTIENDAFDGRDYVDKTLIPEMNRFYRTVRSQTRLPNRSRSLKIAPLRKLTAVKNESGVSYASRFRESCGDIRELKDCFRGRRGFIVATGPSLTIDDLDKLKGEVTFSCNKITLGFDETEWRPTFYSIIDSVVAETFEYDFNKLDSIKVFPEDMQKYYKGVKDTFFIKNLTPKYIGEERLFEFGKDLASGGGGGFTVIYTLMQLAYYVGIEELYLLGLDFSFSFDKVSDKRSPKNEPIIVSSGERNHFHKGYRAVGDHWTIPRLDLQKSAFAKAKEVFEEDGRKILNASRKTELELFERVDLDNVLNEKEIAAISSKPPRGHEAFGSIQKAEVSEKSGMALIEGWVWPKPQAIEVILDGEVQFSTVETEVGPQTIENHTFASPIAKWRAAILVGRKFPTEIVVRFIYLDGENFFRSRKLSSVPCFERPIARVLSQLWARVTEE